MKRSFANNWLPPIAFDLDDCIFDLKCAEQKWASKHLGIPINDKIWKVNASNTPRQMGLTGQAYDDYLSSIADAIIAGNLTVLPKRNSIQSINKLQKKGFKIVYLTGRKDKHWQGNAQLHAERQIKATGLNPEQVVSCNNKGAWCHANGVVLLVDDNPKYAKQANELGIRTLLLRTDYNTHYKHVLNDHVTSWKQIPSKVISHMTSYVYQKEQIEKLHPQF